MARVAAHAHNDQTNGTDARVELAHALNLLSVLRGWRVLRSGSWSSHSPGAQGLRIGEWIRRLLFLRFGVTFECDLFLLQFRCVTQGPRRVRLRLVWQARSVHPEWQVFVHFLNAEGQICFQGDHALGGRSLDRLGFLYYELLVAVPEEVPAGEYAIRMGVWWPHQQRHLRVYGFRGVRQEQPGWCENAVYVSGSRID